MFLVYILLIALLFGWFLATTELPMALSGLVSTRHLRGYGILAGFILCCIAGGIYEDNIGHKLEEQIRIVSPLTSLMVAGAAFVSVLLVSRISRFSSVISSSTTAFAAWMIFSRNPFSSNFILRNTISWFSAPFIAVILAYFLTFIYKKYITPSNIHFFRLSYYLRIGIVVNTLIFALLFGANNGLVLLILNSTVRTDFKLFMAQMSFPTDSFLLAISVLAVF